MGPTAFDVSVIDAPTIAGNLKRFQRRPLALLGRRHAAVALAIVEDPVLSFLLTQRPLHAPRHAGQFALPGGRTESGEDAAQTARRELQEELGVQAAPTAVLGWLDDYATQSGFVITPVVMWCGIVPDLSPDPGEVAVTHRIPLARLLDEDVVQQHPGSAPERPILSLGLANTQVFAPTAAMILQFREVALLGGSLRVDHFDQPRFAWK